MIANDSFIVARNLDRFLFDRSRCSAWNAECRRFNLDEYTCDTRSINGGRGRKDFNKIHEKGVKITSQMVPTTEDFMKLLK